MSWITEYGATVVVLLLLAFAVFLAARSLYRTRKRGGCAGCSGSCGKADCPSAPKAPFCGTVETSPPPRVQNEKYDPFSS